MIEHTLEKQQTKEALGKVKEFCANNGKHAGHVSYEEKRGQVNREMARLFVARATKVLKKFGVTLY